VKTAREFGLDKTLPFFLGGKKLRTGLAVWVGLKK
jgi:hypothetical protein